MAPASRPEFSRYRSTAGRRIWCHRSTVPVFVSPTGDSPCGEQTAGRWSLTTIAARFSMALSTESISRSVGSRISPMLLSSRFRDPRACASKTGPYYASITMGITATRSCRSAAFSSSAISSRARKCRPSEFVNGHGPTHKTPRSSCAKTDPSCFFALSGYQTIGHRLAFTRCPMNGKRLARRVYR